MHTKELEPFRRDAQSGTKVGGMQTEAKLYFMASLHTLSRSVVVIVGERKVWSIMVATLEGKGGGGGGGRREEGEVIGRGKVERTDWRSAG